MRASVARVSSARSSADELEKNWLHARAAINSLRDNGFDGMPQLRFKTSPFLACELLQRALASLACAPSSSIFENKGVGRGDEPA